MSHKATRWLSELPPRDLGHSEFRVLFHLCDCHNPAQGCFPTQAYLLDACGIANSTLNVALANLEARGLIRRHRTIDGKSKRQRPTRYILGFEFAKPQEPTPETGDGTAARNRPEPTPETGDGADSGFDPEPTPISGQSRLRPAGEEPVIEPVINQTGASGDGKILEFWAARIAAKTGHIPTTAVRPEMARQLLRLGLATAADLTRHQITF